MDEALDKAVRVFCERGYHATSIEDLKEAMGLTSGSIYKAFKDKRAVFLAALDRYKLIRDRKLRQAIESSKSGRDRLRSALLFYADSSHGSEGRRGCLVVGGASELAIFDADIAKRMTAALTRNETLLADLIRQGQSDGSIGAGLDSEATARLMLCLVQGMRVLGKTGRSRAEMEAVVETAMKVLA
jgi:AcrR family transcriptional regulator